jgi:hypothetical protein
MLVEEEDKADDATEDSVAFIPDDDDEKSDVDELFLSLITAGSNCSISIMIAFRPLIKGSN